ncbi:hypothetical protein ACFSHO_10545 [Acinetobacter vivianii]
MKRWILCLYVVPILLALTACNDSNDDQVTAKPDDAKKTSDALCTMSIKNNKRKSRD